MRGEVHRPSLVGKAARPSGRAPGGAVSPASSGVSERVFAPGGETISVSKPVRGWTVVRARPYAPRGELGRPVPRRVRACAPSRPRPARARDGPSTGSAARGSSRRPAAGAGRTTTRPSDAYSVTYGEVPQPTSTFPFDSTWALPSARASTCGWCMYRRWSGRAHPLQVERQDERLRLRLHRRLRAVVEQAQEVVGAGVEARVVLPRERRCPAPSGSRSACRRAATSRRRSRGRSCRSSRCGGRTRGSGRRSRARPS